MSSPATLSPISIPNMPADVKTVFDSYPQPQRTYLNHLRNLIFEVAAETEGVGELEETFKWGQPSYLTTASKSGSTIRLGMHGNYHYALYVHCQTKLLSRFRDIYGSLLSYDGKRALVFERDFQDDATQVSVIKDCIALALTYHCWKNEY
ncbi:MAG: DUF1801 domain-containing protein [Deinococcota bacterium]